MTAALRPYATTHQTDVKRCLVCIETLGTDKPFVAVLTPVRGRFHWMHAGLCHDQHIARCGAERQTAEHERELEGV